MKRCDLHVHSFASYDCLNDAKSISKVCASKKIEVIAVTDHNEIFGAQFLKERLKDIQVIIGEEISTKQGEVIGLFINERIEPGLSLEDTLDKIHFQGGITYLPHPFDASTGRRHAVSREEAERVKDKLDIIEIFNARTFKSVYNDQAKDFSEKNKIQSAVGSDAHTPGEIGNAIVQIESFKDKNEFLINVKTSKTVTKKAALYYFVITKVVRACKKYLNFII